MPFFRLLKILRVFSKYRLDSLLPRQHLPFVLRFFPWRLFSIRSSELDRGKRLRLAMEELGPVFVKFGQLLSTRPDVIAADIAKELSLLQDDVPPFDSEQFVAIVERALGDKVDNIFKEFDREPLASASVAQVHAAVLQNNKEVVVKVIRPDIEAVIEQDLSLMLLMAKIIQRVLRDGKRLRPVEVVKDYRWIILNELDLQCEAANASQLRRNFKNSEKLYVPEVFWDYCRPDVMVMERIYGIPISDIDALKAQNTNFQLLAEHGVELFFTQVFDHNFFHADMHPGNIFVSTVNPSQPQYIAVDCAIVGSLSREDQYYLARNLLAIFRQEYRQVAELHVSCGWVPADINIADFEAAIRTVCEPIFERPLSKISYGEILLKLFQTARRFEMDIQPSLVLLQKTLLNIEGLGRQLYPELDLWTTAKPFLENWMKERLQPKAILEELKYYGPEWAEKLPQVPDLLFGAVEQVKHLDKVATSLQSIVNENKVNRPSPQNTFIRGLGVGSLALAASTLYPFLSVTQVPLISVLAGTIGVYLLLRK